LRDQQHLQQALDLISSKLDFYNKELYRIDPHLKVMLAKPNAEHEALRPGYYHLIRMEPGRPAYVKPVEYDNGEWCDLDSSIFDLVAENDLWNDRAVADRKLRQRRAEAARQRQRDRESQDRVTEYNERWKSANSTQISVSRSIK
jgi:hypothetical protein